MSLHLRIGITLVLALGACTVSSSTPPPAPSAGAKPPVEHVYPSKPASSESEPTTPASSDAPALEIPHDMPSLDTPCDTRRDFALKQVSDALEFASAGCSDDDDCVQATRGTGCRGSCPTAVLATHADAYEALRSSVDERVCSTYRDDGCPYATPRCMGGSPKCVEGSCEIAR